MSIIRKYGSSISLYLPLTGGTLTGALTVSSSAATAFIGERTTTGNSVYQAKNTVGIVYFGAAGTTANFAVKFADADLTASPILLIDRTTNATTLLGALATTAATLSTDRGLLLTNQTSAAAAQVGTLNNAPVAGNPGFWLKISIGGVNYSVPAWTA